MPIGKRTAEIKQSARNETLLFKFQMKSFAERLSSLRNVFEGVDRARSVHMEICGIEDLLETCDLLLDDYLESRIDLQSLQVVLKDHLIPDIFDELMYFGDRELELDEEVEELVGPLSALDDESEGAELDECMSSNQNLRHDIDRIIERLITPIRLVSVELRDELSEIYPQITSGGKHVKRKSSH